jgi:hypothetical protein
MAQEAFLQKEDKDPSILTCSLCRARFHTSPIGPLPFAKNFEQHVKDEHPGAVVKKALIFEQEED